MTFALGCQALIFLYAVRSSSLPCHTSSVAYTSPVDMEYFDLPTAEVMGDTRSSLRPPRRRGVSTPLGTGDQRCDAVHDNHIHRLAAHELVHDVQDVQGHLV